MYNKKTTGLFIPLQYPRENAIYYDFFSKGISYWIEEIQTMLISIDKSYSVPSLVM